MDILEYLQLNTGCVYLSDLCNARCHQKLKEFLHTCDVAQFSVEEWAYAYTYIFNAPCKHTDVDALHTAFISHLV